MQEKHTQQKFPHKDWDIESMIANAIGNDAYGEMATENYARLAAEVALGIKALNQQPKQLDPVSFQAAMVANHIIQNAEFKDGEAFEGAEKLRGFYEQSAKYLQEVEINFGQQQGLRR